MIRLRATAALTAVLLLPLAACAAPPDAGSRPAATSTPDERSEGPAAPESTTAAEASSSGPDPVAPGPAPGAATDEGTPPADPAGPVDPALGAGIDVTGLGSDAALGIRADPSVTGAEVTAAVFTGAWSAALQTGDGSTVRALSGPGCAFCASVADTAEATPLGTGLEVLTTIWPVSSQEPTEAYPYRVVVAGMEQLVVRTSDGPVPHVEVVTQRRQLLSMGMEWTDAGWTVHGVDSQPWDGSDPLAG
ncbi:hypothetical protein N866_08685 [Actinotalea ferrariae CF5-4]|uniref:Lipoprotein n=1 Tax=Actinotalea ferrariae CF5-4 TaxID=948458 RepID=A0A021VTV8_9CELL|nr:hypothetical protein [Actinotalea ferrariae]EYR64563.1 hypothetical protein N866_08685 [Actinotalea ferrariae CF5-4]